MEKIIFHLTEALRLLMKLDKAMYPKVNSRYQQLKDFIRLLESEKKQMEKRYGNS